VKTQKPVAELWSVPGFFHGKTVAVLGTGPSLKKTEADLLKSHSIPSIAVNNAYEIAPWAEILYAADRKWWEGYWNKGALGGPGCSSYHGICVTMEAPPYDPGINVIGNGGSLGMDSRKDHVRTGFNSPAQAAQIAFHAGAKTVLLFGCDCRDFDGKTHFFGEHPWTVPKNGNKYSTFLIGWKALADAIAGTGKKIINCSPLSAINFFEKQNLQDLLEA
jgi:hypothetical protein